MTKAKICHVEHVAADPCEIPGSNPKDYSGWTLSVTLEFHVDTSEAGTHGAALEKARSLAKAARNRFGDRDPPGYEAQTRPWPAHYRSLTTGAAEGSGSLWFDHGLWHGKYYDRDGRVTAGSFVSADTVEEADDRLAAAVVASSSGDDIGTGDDS